MPATVNGIGTHYYFKRNRNKEQGVCERCGRPAALESYETWLWFCVVFIPILPLGKRQILNYCPHCTAHRAMPYREWEKLRDRSIQANAQEASKDPNDADAAMRMHATLRTFGKREEARRALELLQQRFAGNVDVALYAGAMHEREGRGKEADACFERALALAPENKAARRAVGIGMIQRGELDRARDMLAHLLAPGPDADIPVGFMLAGAFQKAGRHDQALTLFQTLLTLRPECGAEKPFRKAVAASEKAAGRRATILPPRVAPWGKIGLAAASAAAVAIAVAVINAGLARNQTLHIVNGLPVAVRVDLGRGAAVSVRPGRRETARVPEGRITAHIAYPDGAADQVAFEIRNGWWERFSHNSVFVLNPGKGALVVREVVAYASRASGAAPVPRPSLQMNRDFFTFRGVDYAFQEAPQSLRVESGRGAVRKTRVDWVAAEPAAIVASLMQEGRPGELMTFVESHLRFAPGDRRLLELYVSLSVLGQAGARAADFLKAGLDRQPAEVNWHRMYQTVSEREGRGAQLAADYDRLLAAAPTNAVLLYLRGRCAGSAEAPAYYDRAIAAAPQFSYAHFAKSYALASRGQMGPARAECAAAMAGEPRDDAFENLWTYVQFALGNTAELEAWLRERLAAEPLNREAAGHLMQCLLARGDRQAAQKVQADLAAHAAREMPGDPHQLGLLLQSDLLYQLQEFEDLRRTAGRLTGALSRPYHEFAALVELGNPAEAATVLTSTPALQTPFSALELALAFARLGDAEGASTWREKAVQRLREGGRDEALLADALAASSPPSPATIDQIGLFPSAKRLALVALAERHPGARPMLLDRADALRGAVEFPSHLLDRLTAGMRTP